MQRSVTERVRVLTPDRIIPRPEQGDNLFSCSIEPQHFVQSVPQASDGLGMFPNLRDLRINIQVLSLLG